MQTKLPPELLDSPQGAEALSILRSCVHCGFCNATCPTYGLLGDERDGPRGRIYLIKQFLEGAPATRETQSHLDRCLTCRACETTCPSGVRYSRLLDIGRTALERQVRRPLFQRFKRDLLLRILPFPGRLRLLLRLLGPVRPVLPGPISSSLPRNESTVPWPTTRHQRAVLLLQGCVQSVIAPRINLAAARVLDRLGVSAIAASGCCGAMSMHLSREQQGLDIIRRNVDAWWPLLEPGVEAIVLTATGCTPMVADYGRLLQNDQAYAARAARISALSMELSEFLDRTDLSSLKPVPEIGGDIAFHAPCTLQHALGGADRLEALLTGFGFSLTRVEQAHLCCGSAGSYSLLQPELSQRLLGDKLRCLEKGEPSRIVTANIGCLQHLQSGTSRPVRHWIELLG
jgi:glycolate oxidase iron-sulfur subunit